MNCDMLASVFMSHVLPSRDQELVQIVDAAFADAARKAGAWLICRSGCTQCCVGAFPINALDAARLRAGLAELKDRDPDRAKRVRQRAQEYIKRISADFPGDSQSGILGNSEESEQRFSDFANDEVCPALDPKTGTCDLYELRPMTCRVFGPPIRTEDGALAVCELCFKGASNEQIAACEMTPDPDRLEDSILGELGDERETIVAFVLAKS